MSIDEKLDYVKLMVRTIPKIKLFGITETHPGILINLYMNSILPHISTINDLFKDKLHLLEQYFQVLKSCIRCLPKEIGNSELESTIALSLQIFSATEYSGFFYLVGVIPEHFTMSMQTTKIVFNAFEDVYKLTLKYNPKDLSPEYIEDFFLFVKK